MSSAKLERGAVNVVFLIVVVIVMLVFAVLWFTQMQDNGDLAKKLEAEKAKAEAGENKLGFAEGCYAELAKIIGAPVPAELPKPDNWDKRGAVLPQDPEVLGKHLDAVRMRMKEAATQTEETAAPVILVDALDKLSSRYKAVKNDKGAVSAVVDTKDAEIASLTKRLSDAEAAAAAKQQELNTERENQTARLSQQLNESNTQRDDAQAKNRELTDEVGKAKETSNKEVTTAKGQMKTLEASVNSLKANLRTQRDTEKPDGKVLAVNRAMGTLWINVGGKQRLRRGTTFKVYETVKGGEKLLKGRITVTSVEADKSECRVDSDATMAGIAEGDWITNPFFDPTRATRFVFLGELTGRYNKEVAKRMLEQSGAKVDDKVTVETDFVVLGLKEAPDAPELTESADYKQAQAWGIEVIRSRDLETYLSN